MHAAQWPWVPSTIVTTRTFSERVISLRKWPSSYDWCRAKSKICTLSPLMVTYHLRKNILEWEFRQCILAISLISALENECGPSFEQTWFPFTQGCFVPWFVEVGPVVLESNISKFRHFVIISPWKRAWSFFWKTFIPLTRGCFVPSLVENGPVVLEKNIKMWKVYRQTDRRRTTGNLSFQVRWAKLDPDISEVSGMVFSFRCC